MSSRIPTLPMHSSARKRPWQLLAWMLLAAAALLLAAVSPATASPASLPSASPPYAAAEVERAFAFMDANRDGRISRAEASGFRGVARHFDAADSNRDSALSRAEFESALNKKKPAEPVAGAVAPSPSPLK